MEIIKDMSQKTGTKKDARKLQKRTGWSYSECLRCITELTSQEIEALFALRGNSEPRKDKR